MKAQAMILAAGRGNRMRPLTDATPKPLLSVQGKPLMQWPLQALARSGFTRVVVNTGWLGDQIPAYFGESLALPGAATVQIHYSHESRSDGQALETAGGIARALPELDDVFWVLAGDVFVPDFVFSPQAVARLAASSALAHLWLVPNPAHNLRGDFGISEQGVALDLPPDEPDASKVRYTYSTIGLYRAALFAPPWCDIAPGNPHGVRAPLAPLLRAAMAQGRVSAELYTGAWTDVGTPERLAQLNGAAR